MTTRANFPIIMPGDVGLVDSEALFSKLIIIRDKFISLDGKAQFGHGFIITGYAGRTFESRRRIAHYNMFDEFPGKRCLIVRPEGSQNKKMKSIGMLEKKYDGLIYPGWRIAVHLIAPWAARHLHASGIPVCTELIAEHEYNLGLIDEFWGQHPDSCEDRYRHWKGYQIIFDGYLPTK